MLRNYALSSGLVDAIAVGRGEEIVPTIIDELINNGELSEHVYTGHKGPTIGRTAYHVEAKVRDSSHVFTVSEGCREKPCTFCSTGHFSRGHLAKPIEQIEEELEDLRRSRGIKKRMRLIIPDDNPWSPLMNVTDEEGFRLSREQRLNRVTQIGEVFRKYDVGFISFLDMPAAKDLELMEILRWSGMKLGLIGIESINPNVLANMTKQNKVEDYALAANNFRQTGIYSNSTVVFVPDVDTVQTAAHTGRTLREAGIDYSTFFIATPLVGTLNFGELRGKMIDPEWYTERRNLLNQAFRAKKTSMKQSWQMIVEAYSAFYNKQYFASHIPRMLKRTWVSEKSNNLGSKLRRTAFGIVYPLSTSRVHGSYLT